MTSEKRKGLRRSAVHTALSEREKEKLEAIAEEFGGITPSETLRKLVWDYELKNPQE